MDNLRQEVLNEFRREMIKICENEIKKYVRKNLEVPYYGVVVGKTNATGTTPAKYNVDIGFMTVSDLLNKSGEELSLNDGVKIFTQGGNMVDSYIGVKTNG